ncbi:hypothetical protein [Alloalcanivorax gelatiniphagus]|uniref:Lipoprotein n=1 Tax=Alloalcanivorax gelatiniphagus TaxID=1194167 RepID=A0ABY2XL44_9GAMM|nr:hypothetical protein [Alloalcanivorax gelatiniphagus]TMW11949.1 hypothetical protein FGS76_13055 [Alloalcanivorax gelatiniphagus]
MSTLPNKRVLLGRFSGANQTSRKCGLYEKSMKISVLVLLAFLSGCAAVDVSKTDVVGGIVGKCYEFTEEGELLKVSGSDKERVMKFTWSYLFLSTEGQSLRRKNKDVELVKTLEPGTKLEITKVIKYPYGSAGQCWVVKARLLDVDTKGKAVEIPSCWVWDKPIWVSPESPSQLEQGPEHELRVDTPVLTPSPCS